MGNSKSKVRKLSPKTLAELQKNVDVDISREEIEEWFREYQSSLGKGMSKLTMKEFKEVYNSVFDGEASVFVSHLFRSFDEDQDGFVDFKEFIVGLCVSGSDKAEAKLKWAFKMYDIDGNGSISREEMTSMLKAIYRMIATDLSSTKTDLHLIEDLVSAFFKSADRNHDNAISAEEFVEGVKEMPVILHLLQCDPDSDSGDFETIEKFDSLQVSEKQLSSNKGGKKSAKASGSDRSTAYKTQ
ncbi:hippocalcin-like protein 1 [Mercenaria mercenaria]|uniref:hippocalcin-like protein 1 n=1 Tax=Mercenaria mercenaria TaxID=6596 RepID=UPI00234FA39A|nr:hippocalcin-like protein 1 [Mercenaria mercenaria]